jgi:hypothetical protein
LRERGATVDGIYSLPVAGGPNGACRRFDLEHAGEFAVRIRLQEENLRRRGAHPNTSLPRAATNCRIGPRAAGTALPPQCRSSQPYNC